MASAIRQMTGVGGDVRKIARLLQKKAPPGHMLAYINQEEADLLKARGGSGKPHADTGVPSFESEDPSSYLPEYSDIPWSQREIPTPEQQAFKEIYNTSAAPKPAAEVPMTDASSGYYRPYYADPVAPEAAVLASADGTVSFRDALATPRERGARESFDTSTIAPGGSEAPATKVDKGIGDEVKDWWKGLGKDTKARLGIGGIEAVIGAYQTNQAAEQARKAREDIAKVAQPYQEQGRKLIAQAQSGALTPAAQQTLQAAQAQAAQGAEKRGGVGAQQAQAQVEGLRQQLLQQQYDYGLKVLGIGDSIAVGAIKAGMQADQYVNQLANNYSMNIARTVAGTPTYVDARQSGVVA